MSGQQVAWLGVDPGVNGAIALVHPDNSLSRSWDLPTIKVPAPGNKRTKSGKLRYRTLLDEVKIIEVLARIREAAAPYPLAGVIEAVAPMRHKRKGKGGQDVMQSEGALGAFNFGASWGLVRGLVRHFCPYFLAYPIVWRPKMVGSGTEKQASLALASTLFPHLEFPRKMDEHRAEALLLATFGARYLYAEINEQTGVVNDIRKAEVPSVRGGLPKLAPKQGNSGRKRAARRRRSSL